MSQLLWVAHILYVLREAGLFIRLVHFLLPLAISFLPPLYMDFSCCCGTQWGVNAKGQCGTGDTEGRGTPTHIKVGEETDSPTSVACGEHHSAVITSEGSLYMFGSSVQGQVPFFFFPHFLCRKETSDDLYSLKKLGLGDIQEAHLPTKLTGIPPIRQVSCGVAHSAFVAGSFPHQKSAM